MNKVLIVLIAIVLSIIPYHSHAKELILENQLFDKSNVGKIKWKTILNNKRFNNRILRTEIGNYNPVVWQYYGEIIFSGVPLELAVELNTEKQVIAINASAFKDSPQSKISIKNKVVNIYGDNYIVHKRRLNAPDGTYIVFETMQWNIGTSRIQLMTISTHVKDSPAESVESLIIGNKDILQEYKPVKFITCSHNITYSSGNTSKLNYTTIGIDDVNNIVVDTDYNELKYIIDGEYIKLNISDDKKTITTLINRTTGKLTSTIDIDKRITQVNGICTPQLGKRLF